jgi:hypothetical protein
MGGNNCKWFNDKYEVGSNFIYQSVIGVTDKINVATRSEAWDLSHGDTIVKVTGVTGGVCISHLIEG